MTQRNSSTLNPDAGVIDTTFLARELKRNKWLIMRMSITLAGIALMFALKPSYPQVSATLRVDPPAGVGFAGAMHNVDTEIGSLRSYSSVERALQKANYYAEVTVIELTGKIDSPLTSETYRGDLQFGALSFPPAMHGREWIIEIVDENIYRLKTPKGEVIANGHIGELLTGQAETTDMPNKNGQYRLQIDAIHATAGSSFSIKPSNTDMLIRKILAKLDINKRSSSPGSNLLDVELAMADSTLSYLIVKYLSEGYIYDSMERQTAAQKEAIARLKMSLLELKAEMEQRKQDMLDFYAETNAIEPQIQARNLLQQRLEMEEALKSAQVKLGQLQEIYTDKHPAIRAVTHEIRLMETSLAQLSEHISVLPSQESRLNQLERELNISVDLYQTSIKELARVQLEISRLPQTVHMIDAPRLHKKGRLKYLIQLVIFGGMLGLIAGLSLVLLSASMKLGRLYMLPQLKTLTKHSINQAVLKLSANTLSPNSAKQLSQLISYNYSAKDQQIIACCSSTQQTKTANLSIQFAAKIAKTKRTLLIDAHMYQSPLTAIINSQNDAGFSEWMSGRVGAQKVIRKSSHAGLSIMPAGEELLNYDLLRNPEIVKAKLQTLTGFDVIVLYMPEPEDLPQPEGLFDQCDYIIHWLELFTTLERIHSYLQWFEELKDPKQNIYAYEVIQKPKKTKAQKSSRRADNAPPNISPPAHSRGRVFVG